MKRVLPFENSANEYHYISDSFFVVYNKKLQCYITRDALSNKIEDAEKFKGCKDVDFKHKTIIVFNDEGEFLIDRNGRIAGPYDFIGFPCSEGTRPARKKKENINLWGYLQPVIHQFKKPKLFANKEDDSFFVATKIGGYNVNGYEIENRKCEWLIGFDRKKHNSSKKIIGILHSEFRSFHNTNIFFAGVSENAYGKQLLTIYKTNKKEDRVGILALERPYNSPDSYIDVVYLGNGRFKVTQKNGLISILYFDTKKKEFIYWPETDRRSFTSYTLKNEFVIAGKENGDLSILHQSYGDLTIFWDKVHVNGEDITYLYNNKEYSTNFSNLINSYNQSIAVVKRDFQANEILKEDINTEIDKSNISEQDNLMPLDWVVLLANPKKNCVRKSFNNDYEVSIPRKVLNAPRRRKLQNGDNVAIINIRQGYLLYGTLKNLLLSSRYYLLAEEELTSIKKDFTIFKTILSKGHFFIGSLIDVNLEDAIYKILKRELKASESTKEIYKFPTVSNSNSKLEITSPANSAELDKDKHICHNFNHDQSIKKVQIEEIAPIIGADFSFDFLGKRYEVGSIMPAQLLNRNRRIYFKKDPGILFIKIDCSSIIEGTNPRRYQIEGVGQGNQEFMTNNENTRIRDSRNPIILIKESNGVHIYYDIVQFESYERTDSKKGSLISFTLKSIS